MRLCPHDATETKCYCVTIEQSIKIYHDAHDADLHNRCGYAYNILYKYMCIFIYIYIHIYIYIYKLKN